MALCHQRQRGRATLIFHLHDHATVRGQTKNNQHKGKDMKAKRKTRRQRPRTLDDLRKYMFERMCRIAHRNGLSEKDFCELTETAILLYTLEPAPGSPARLRFYTGTAKGGAR